MGLEYNEQEIITEQDLAKMEFGQKGYLGGTGYYDIMSGTGYYITRVTGGWIFENRRSMTFVPLPKINK